MTLTAAFIGPASTPVGVPDGLWSLLRGAWMVGHRALLDSDPFTSAPHIDGALVNVQWLGDLALYLPEALGGIPLVIVFTALVVTLTYAIVLAATYAASGHLRLSCVAVWIAFALGATNLSPRPQTLSYPFFATFVFAVMRDVWRKDPRWLWLLPPITVLWANVHGSFFLGFVLLGCAAVATRSPRYVVALSACIIASFVNPYGPGALVYVAGIGTNPVIRDYVTEWAPTAIDRDGGIVFFVSLVLLGALALRARVRLSLFEWVVLLVFGALAWSSVRVVVWWGILLASTLARLLGDVLPAHRPTGRDRPLVNVVVVALALGVAGLSLPWTKSALPILPVEKRGLFSSVTPVAVGEYLRTHDGPASGRMLNHQTWGGYLEWIAWPRHQVFLDGRIELHPNQVWFDYLRMVFPSARWRQLFADYDITYVVLSRDEEAELIADLRADPGWHTDYEDDQAIVLSRV
jgi:hypothetical protein